MRMRVFGNSASGKTTLSESIANYFGIECLHLDSVAFKPNSDFELRDSEEMKSDITAFLSQNNKFIIEGNYKSTTRDLAIFPNLVLYIDLPISESLTNFDERFKKYEGVSRPEFESLNIIEKDYDNMVEWIKSYEERRPEIEQEIIHLQLANPMLHVIRLESMDEVITLSNNLHLLCEFM